MTPLPQEPSVVVTTSPLPPPPPPLPQSPVPSSSQSAAPTQSQNRQVLERNQVGNVDDNNLNDEKRSDGNQLNGKINCVEMDCSKLIKAKNEEIDGRTDQQNEREHEMTNDGHDDDNLRNIDSHQVAGNETINGVFDNGNLNVRQAKDKANRAPISDGHGDRNNEDDEHDKETCQTVITVQVESDVHSIDECDNFDVKDL